MYLSQISKCICPYKQSLVAVNRNGQHVVDNPTAFSAETFKAWERLDSAETTIDFFYKE